FIRMLVERQMVVHLISIFLILLGVYSALSINREAFPNVNMDRIEVSVTYPGATPEEVEKLIITPIEQELKALSGIDKMNSIAFPGSARIQLELDPDASNRHRITTDVQLATDRASLPQDLPFDPIVTELEGAVFPIIQLAVSADRSPIEIMRLGDKLVDDLTQLNGVARVVVQGKRKAEMRVVPDLKKMEQHRVSVGQLIDLLKNWNINAPAGDIDTKDGQKSVRIVGEFNSTQDIADLVIRANLEGGGLRLGDIAQVVEDLEEPRVYYDVDGRPALNMIVMKKQEGDIINTVDTVKEYLSTVAKTYGADVHVDTFQDFSRFTRLRLGILTNNGLVGLILVFISLVLFLRPSVALTTTWGLPIVFLTGLFILMGMGVTLNLISMLGFIMVLGMLVDDAIIVGENITYHMEKGRNPREAAVIGAVELMGPVTTTVLTTIIAFVPMFFVSGMIGKFIVAIPTVVILLLALSWLESFFILPSHVASVANAKVHPKERRWLVWLENTYAYILAYALRWKWATIAVSIVILIGSLFLAKMSSFELFPAAGLDQYVVRVSAQPGISLEDMREKLKKLEVRLRAGIEKEYLETTIISTGQIAMDAADPLMQRGSRYGQIRVIYIPAVLRPDHSALDDMHRLEKEVQKEFPALQISFTEVKPGPPTGRALQAEISGTNPEASAQAARQLMEFLKDIKGVNSVESDLQPGDEELHIVVDRKLAAYAGINLTTIAGHVRAAVDGLRVSTARRGTE
ncbi:MAG: efflux RND transporter permease subunit, partial [Gammaproteobacteria bacterium]|nr:efflux RND transporter permease subunit [Gammaproteobacteria bacterium]